MGRPRKDHAEETVSLAFQASAAFVKEIDAEGERMHTELGVKLSRTQVVLRLLREALRARGEKRTK